MVSTLAVPLTVLSSTGCLTQKDGCNSVFHKSLQREGRENVRSNVDTMLGLTAKDEWGGREWGEKDVITMYDLSCPGSCTEHGNPAPKLTSQRSFLSKEKPIRKFSIDPASSIRTRLQTPFVRDAVSETSMNQRRKIHPEQSTQKTTFHLNKFF